LCLIGQRFRNADQSVAVSIRFHDGEHLSGPDSIPHDFRIVPQSGAINFTPAAVSFFHFGMVMCGSRK
jgi:hypothetical protein